jgi:hypothetical protein
LENNGLGELKNIEILNIFAEEFGKKLYLNVG